MTSLRQKLEVSLGRAIRAASLGTVTVKKVRVGAYHWQYQLPGDDHPTLARSKSIVQDEIKQWADKQRELQGLDIATHIIEWEA